MSTSSLSLAASISFTLLSAHANAQSTTANHNMQEIEKVAVVSSRISLPTNRLSTSVTVLDELDLQLSSATNITDILRSTPSVGVSNSGGLGKNTVLRIRGEEGFRTKLYIDDVELSDVSSPQVAPIFDDMLVDNLSRVEILRGTQGLVYGADAGGIIALYSKQQQQGFHAGARVSVARYNTQGFSGTLAAGNENGNLFLSASTLSSDGFNAQTEDMSDEVDGYENQTIHFKGQVNLSEAIEAKVVVRQVVADNQYDGCFDNRTFAPTNQCVTEAQQKTLRASLAYTTDTFRHEISAHKTDVERRFLSNQQFGFANNGSIDKLEYLGSAKWRNYDLVFGAETRQETLDNEQVSRDQNSVFVEWLGSFSNSIYVNLGVRHDDNDTFGKHNSVRAGLVKQIQLTNLDIKLKTTYGTGFRAPSLFEQSYNDGPFAYGLAAGLQLTEETSEGLDVGFELDNRAGTLFEAVVFNQKIENEIVFDLSSFQGYLQTMGSSESKGLELNLQHGFNNGVELSANYTYNHATTNDDQRRLRRPRHKFNLGISKALIDDALKIAMNHRVVNDAVDIGGNDLDDYSITDVTARWQVAELLSITAGLSNLFDRDYQEVSGFNTAGRSLYVSASFSM
jgi:vitamin B12 transporter